MQLNLLPCYQVVHSEGAYFLCKWSGGRYEIQEITREKPECIGNCIVFYDKASSSPFQKRYRLWWIDEDDGCCLSCKHAFDKWMYHEGHFLCCHQHSNRHPEEEWKMVMPDEKKQALSTIILGQMICDKFMCFILKNEKQEIILSSFPRGYVQQGTRQQVVIDDYFVVNGGVWYRIGDEVFYSSEFSLPDGSKGWRFVKDSDGLENWNSLKSEN